MILEKFAPSYLCRKCTRETEFTESYCPGGSQDAAMFRSANCSHISTEHLHVSCMCGYEWLVGCADLDEAVRSKLNVIYRMRAKKLRRGRPAEMEAEEWPDVIR